LAREASSYPRTAYSKNLSLFKQLLAVLDYTSSFLKVCINNEGELSVKG